MKRLSKLADRSHVNLVHGHARTGRHSPEYRTWADMKARCENPKNRTFKHYGGRGICVCERWHKFENFLTDMGLRPEGMSLERIDNDLGYSPINCRWATRREQANNCRNTVKLTLGGVTLTISEWTQRLGFRYTTIRNRLKNGWSVERALTEPLHELNAAARLAKKGKQ